MSTTMPRLLLAAALLAPPSAQAQQVAAPIPALSWAGIKATMGSLATRAGAATGISTIEATTVLLSASVLAGTLAPAANDLLAQARLTRAIADTRTIAVSMVREVDDVWGQRRIPGGVGTYELLVGAGDAPESADPRWTLARANPRVGSLDEQLLTNGPGYAVGRRGLAFPTGWRGPYLQSEVTADPWGRRYAVNSRWLGEDGEGHPILVISPGPDGMVEAPYAGTSLPPSGDDVIAVISNGR